MVIECTNFCTFYSQGWRRPKSRTVMPRTSPSHSKQPGGGGADSNNDSSPSTPIGQNDDASANETPPSPQHLPASNNNNNKPKKVIFSPNYRSLEFLPVFL